MFVIASKEGCREEGPVAQTRDACLSCPNLQLQRLKAPKAKDKTGWNTSHHRATLCPGDEVREPQAPEAPLAAERASAALLSFPQCQGPLLLLHAGSTLTAPGWTRAEARASPPLITRSGEKQQHTSPVHRLWSWQEDPHKAEKETRCESMVFLQDPQSPQHETIKSLEDGDYILLPNVPSPMPCTWDGRGGEKP